MKNCRVRNQMMNFHNELGIRRVRDECYDPRFILGPVSIRPLWLNAFVYMVVEDGGFRLRKGGEGRGEKREEKDEEGEEREEVRKKDV